MIFRIPYDLCLKLDLFDDVKKKHIRLVKLDTFLEDVEITGSCENGYIVAINFKFKILNTVYNVEKIYNSSSIYALYMCELNDYNNYNNNSSDDD